jgi:Putative peptidoglycan binding domain/CHAP domain
MIHAGPHPTLRQNDRGAAVRRLQTLLNVNSIGSHLSVDGDFGRSTLDAVRDFQRRNRLDPDGVVGPSTWGVLLNHPQAHSVLRYTVGPQEALAEIARPFLGATEAPGNRMGTDPRMRQIFEADRLAPGGQTDGYPWCCALVSLCVQRLIAANPVYHGLTPPTTPSVSAFRTQWAPSQNCLLFTPSERTHSPHKGDIVVYTFSHIGIVDVVGSGQVRTIEGNTNEAGSREGTICRQKDRAFGIIRCFIRLPVHDES